VLSWESASESDAEMTDTQRAPADKLVGRGRAVEISGLSRSTIARYERLGLFPERVKIGRRALWSLRDLFEWVAEQLANRGESPWGRRRVEREQQRIEHELAVERLEALRTAPRARRHMLV